MAVAASDPSSTPTAICKISFMVLQQLVLLRLLKVLLIELRQATCNTRRLVAARR
jgi:hypothetical protein